MYEVYRQDVFDDDPEPDGPGWEPFAAQAQRSGGVLSSEIIWWRRLIRPALTAPAAGEEGEERNQDGNSRSSDGSGGDSFRPFAPRSKCVHCGDRGWVADVEAMIRPGPARSVRCPHCNPAQPTAGGEVCGECGLRQEDVDDLTQQLDAMSHKYIDARKGLVEVRGNLDASLSREARSQPAVCGGCVMGETMTEEQAIRALKKLAKRWPSSLWLFSAGGTLTVMRTGIDGQMFVSSHGGVDPDYTVTTIDIPNDGGEW